MANQEHLALLLRGVEEWNQWRDAHRDIQPDLRGSELASTQLNHVRLSFSHLAAARFEHAHLHGAYFVRSDLTAADLSGALLTEAHFDRADLKGANLRGANLQRARLRIANLAGADLSGANLRFAELERANCSRADLRATDLSFSRMSFTALDRVDLSTAKGLETVIHAGPTYLGLRTLFRSQDAIPAQFLQGAGVPDTFLTATQTRSAESREYATCALCYARVDHAFIARLQADLQANGVLCYATPYDAEYPSTHAFAEYISNVIEVYDRVLLVTSTYATMEAARRMLLTIVKEALGKEQLTVSIPVLLPIHLDQVPWTMGGSWARLLQLAERHSADFSRWHDRVAYEAALRQLLQDLEMQ